MKPSLRPKHAYHPYIIARIEEMGRVIAWTVSAPSGALLASMPTYDKAETFVLEKVDEDTHTRHRE